MEPNCDEEMSADGGARADQVPKKPIGPSIIAKQMAPSEDVIGAVDNKAL